MQQNYLTPIKQSQQSYHRKLFNSDSVHRQGDWVCFNCQNLNYSFRKKCNRCKTQSREDNQAQAHSVYSYYYYAGKVEGEDGRVIDFGVGELRNSSGRNCKNFGVEDERVEGNPCGYDQCQQNKENIPLNEWPITTLLETPKKKKSRAQSPQTKLDGLPSVSPLIKKYRRNQHHTTIQVHFFHQQQKNNQGTTYLLDTSSPLNTKQFESIRVRDFDKLMNELGGNQGSPFKECNSQNEEEDNGVSFMREIEESIARIII